MTVGITGHRPDKLGNEWRHEGRYSDAARVAIRSFFVARRVTKVYLGMALGIDTIAAQVAIYLGIEVVACIPFKGQCLKWSLEAQVEYWHILQHPLVTVVYVNDGGYTPQAMQKRNEYIVDNVSEMLAVFDGSDGGTANCVAYAVSEDKPVTFISPDELLGW